MPGCHLLKCSQVRAQSQEGISIKQNSLYDQGLRAVGTSRFALYVTRISIVCSPGKDIFYVTEKENSEKNYKYLSIAMITFGCSLWAYHDHSTGKQTNQKRPCHSWWHLRLPQSYLFGLTPQLMATGVGSPCQPQASGNAGQGHLQGGRLTDRWCRRVVQRRNLAVGVRKSGPIFVPFFSFEAQSLVLQCVKPRQSLLFTEGRSRSRAEAGWHLWRWPCSAPCAEQGRLQQLALGCVQLSFEYFQAWDFHSLSEQPVVNLYIVPAKAKSPFALQKLQKAPFGSFHRQCCLSPPV